MQKKSVTERLVIATYNPGKLREFSTLLAPFAPRIVSAGELGLPEPEETGNSFADNALIKARAAASLSGSTALADDSGLCVAALDGRPGILSARWAGPDKNFPMAMAKLNEALGTSPDRSAWFACVLALAWPDGRAELFEGRVDGRILWPPRGTQGHGYDPIFAPGSEPRSFAEMTDVEKNALSHRGIAVRKLIAWLESRT